MTVAAFLTVAVIVAALLALSAHLASADVVLLTAVVVLAAARVIDPNQALSGFGNPGMLTVAALFVVAAGLRETGAVGLLTDRLLGRPRGARAALLRLVPPVLLGSAFLNNTTIVASLLPGVRDWGRRIGVPASALLLPLSFASILGGTITLIGTSTNLVVAGLVDELASTDSRLHPIGMFDVAPLGLAVAGVGALVLIGLGPLLLRDRKPTLSVEDDPRQYTIELLVPEDSRLGGRTIEEAGLRHLPGAFLMEIVRGTSSRVAPPPTERIEPGDRLVMVGDVDAMVDLQRLPGVVVATDQVYKLEGDRTSRVLAEAVVSHRHPGVGRSIRDGRLRSRYRAVVIAVARAGERVRGRIGDIVLQAGDVLLLEARPVFVREQRLRTDFYLVTALDGAAPPPTEKAWIALTVLGALVASVAVADLPAVVAAMVAAGAMVATRCCTLEEARRSLDLQVLVAIAASFGLGHAMQATGVDQAVAGLAAAAGASTPMTALVAVWLVTAAVTAVVTNNAAAVLALPLALSMAHSVGANPMTFVFVVMLAASASFMTPIGYQTNLMVFGPGGYQASDFFRIGVPMTVATGTTTLLVAPLVWPL